MDAYPGMAFKIKIKTLTVLLISADLRWQKKMMSYIVPIVEST